MSFGNWFPIIRVYCLTQLYKMRNGRKRPFWHVGPTKTWSACVSTQSDWSLRCTHEETLHPWLSKNKPREDSDQTARMRSWSESSLGAHVRRYVFWRFAVTRKQKQTFRSAVIVFGRRQHSQAVIWHNPDANIYNVCLFVTKNTKNMETFTELILCIRSLIKLIIIDIIRLISYQVSKRITASF